MQQEAATQFEILNRVDVGGMAEIFRAKNLATGEILAIKRILPSLVGQGDFVNMFIDEAAICMTLHHPNIVRVDQVGLMNEALFLAMEYVDGTNLREVLNYAGEHNIKIPVSDAVRIAINLLDGLAYAHAVCNKNGEPLNLIHRDVSPPNILLGYNGDVKLTDFGLVKSKAQMTHTVPGLIKGKFSYLSPEAAYGESLDCRADLYAVGIVMWEMLTTKPLFTDPNELKILDLVRKSIIPPIAPINPSVPQRLEEIVMKGLSRTRAERYQSAKAFADDLRNFLRSMGNPPSKIGELVAKTKPRKEEDVNAEDLKDPNKVHTRSELIPIDALRQAADEEDAKEAAQEADAAAQDTKKPAREVMVVEVPSDIDSEKTPDDKMSAESISRILTRSRGIHHQSGLRPILLVIIAVLIIAIIAVVVFRGMR